MSGEAFAEYLKAAQVEIEKNDHCMALRVDELGKGVDLVLDTSVAYYGEWIPGEGGDICLYRCHDTKKVVGCYLPLMRSNLVVHHDGPLRINEGFRREE